MNRFIISCLGVAVGSASWGIQYRLIDLGVLPGMDSSFASSINNSGVVTGMSYDPFRWSEATGMQKLPVLEPRGNTTNVNKISSNGTISGTSTTWGNDILQAVIWKNGEIISLPGSLGGDTQAYAVNSQGVAIGTAYLSGGAHDHAVYWENGVMYDLNNFGVAGLNSGAYDINDLGQIVGYVMPSASEPYHPFVWSPTEGMINLGTLEGTVRGNATAINEAGQVVGYCEGRSFFWDKTTGMRDIGWLAGASTVIPNDVNNNGWVVGYAYADNGNRAYLYDGSEIRYLDQLFTEGSSGWRFESANSINDQGWIVGTGVVNGSWRAYLAKPVPEPASLAILSLGLGYLAVRRRRRS